MPVPIGPSSDDARLPPQCRATTRRLRPPPPTPTPSPSSLHPRTHKTHRHRHKCPAPLLTQAIGSSSRSRATIITTTATSATTTIVMCLLMMVTALAKLPATEAGPPRYSSRIVETRTGAIRGVILELDSRHLEPVEAFKAVPYAAAPIGALRFEAPQPLPAWTGTRLADTFGDVCPQTHPDIGNRTAALITMPKGRYQYLRKLLPLLANQSEDCLTLNIYVPGSGNRGLEAPYSVFFFVHGESFEWGSGNPYDGSVLASYGHIIVITVNFRLGILGFLKTRASMAPGSGGNLGVLDILAALQWTKENIAAFGGDPSRVTIVGHDTGAALANLVLISKSGKMLIHRAILLSGSALSPWSVIPDPDAVREEVSQQMACHLDPNGNSGRPAKDVTSDITECLRSKPLEAIMGVRLPNVRFMPSWGPYLPLDDAPDPEFAMEHTGQGFITKELMIGMTTTESYNDFNAADIQYGLEEEQRNRLLRTYVRNAFSFHLNEIFSAVRNEYTDWDKPIQHPINIRDSTMEALSDGHTVAPLIKVGYLHSRRGAKTYLFHFGYQTKDSEYPQRLGSVRGEDLPYIFGQPLVMGQPHFAQNFSRQDMGVAEAVLNFVTNFCKTGDPNEAGHQQAMLHPDYGTTRERTRYRGITWEPYETTSQQYLSISLKPKMRSHYRGHKMSLWLNLIPQLHRPGDPEVSMRHHHFREREPHYYAGNVRAESFTRPIQHFPNGMGEVSGAQESRQQDLYGPDCTPDPTAIGEVLVSDTDEPYGHSSSSSSNTNVMGGNGAVPVAGGPNAENGSDELLQKFANSQYYSSYTAAFGVTVGVGCLLLILNIVIFAGIYYQRERSRRKSRSARCAAAAVPAVTANNGHPQQQHHHHHHHQTSGHGSPIDGVGVGDIPMTVRPTNAAAVAATCAATATAAAGPSPSGKAKGEPPPSYTTLQQRSPCGHHQQQQQQQQHLHQSDGSTSTAATDAAMASGCDVVYKQHQQHQQHQQQQQQNSHYPCGTLQQQQQSLHHQHGGGQTAAVPKSALAKPPPPTRTSSNLSASTSPTPPTTQAAANASPNQSSHQHHQHQHHHHHHHLHPAAAGGGVSGLTTTNATGTLERQHHTQCAPGAGILSGQSSSGGGGSASGGGNTSTLKKRVQIQEIPV